MKQALGIIVAMGFSLYVMFLWGKVFIDVLQHPMRAMELFGFPVLGLLLVGGLIGRFGRHTAAPAEVAKVIEAKTASEHLEISLNEDNQWSAAAVDAARKSFKAQSISAQVEAVAEVRSTRF